MTIRKTPHQSCGVFLTAEILDEYAEHFGAGAKVEYLVLKRFGKIELKIYYTGDKFNPFEDSDDAEELAADKTLRHLLLDKTSTITHSYVLGKNVITINSSARDKEKLEIRSPYLLLCLSLLTMWVSLRFTRC